MRPFMSVALTLEQHEALNQSVWSILIELNLNLVDHRNVARKIEDLGFASQRRSKARCARTVSSRE